MIDPRRQAVPILLAEDDPDDLLLIQDALRAAGVAAEVNCVGDGDELLDYLHQRGQYAPPAPWRRPCLILLDLNMPRLDGGEAIGLIKGDRGLRQIPIVVLTTSHSEEDIERSYDLGANSFITKPAGFERMVQVMRMVGRYWLETVDLPPDRPVWPAPAASLA